MNPRAVGMVRPVERERGPEAAEEGLTCLLLVRAKRESQGCAGQKLGRFCASPLLIPQKEHTAEKRAGLPQTRSTWGDRPPGKAGCKVKTGDRGPRGWCEPGFLGKRKEKALMVEKDHHPAGLRE